MKTMHNIIVQTHLDQRPPNTLLDRPQLDIDKTVETLPHTTRRRTAQLENVKSLLLLDYLNKMDENSQTTADCHYAITTDTTQNIILTVPHPDELGPGGHVG